MSSNNVALALDAAARRTLLDVARDAIGRGLDGGVAVPPRPEDHAPALRETAATFVTLHWRGRLRGCIGTLEACRALVVDTAENAHAAAYRDPRFPRLTPREFEEIDIHISVLTPPEPLPVVDEEDLIARLRPGVDGLILSEGGRRGTFLPAVWASIADPREFLAQLKLKAGMPADYWSPAIRVARYTTVGIP